MTASSTRRYAPLPLVNMCRIVGLVERNALLPQLAVQMAEHLEVESVELRIAAQPNLVRRREHQPVLLLAQHFPRPQSGDAAAHGLERNVQSAADRIAADDAQAGAGLAARRR